MQNDEKERHPVQGMEPETTKNIAYAVMGLSLLLMVWFISQRAMKNRSSMLESNAPKLLVKMKWTVARNPQQFDEPDEDALEEMAKLLGEDEDSGDES